MAPVPSGRFRQHPLPVAVDERTSAAALRTIAILEILKGIAVLVLGALLILFHKHVEDLAESLLFHLHVDLDRRVGHAVMSAAIKLTDARVITILVAATSYAIVRIIEGWGLWHRRVWAEWFALLSGALYLPWEILRITERPDWERVTVLVINIGIILYMLVIRIRESGVFRRSGRQERVEAEEVP